ncbi:MAG: SGNH/GDSL hydrolase family protein [Clostridia bacterium]|nr:SGNH/GDSL hydrolase family protein [Clostridia bacterium]
MKLSFKDLKKITFGAVSVYEDNGYLVCERFTEKQKECYKKYRTISLRNKVNATAGIRFSFKSNTEFIKFNYVLDYASSRQFAYFDVLVNGKIVSHEGTEKICEEEKALEVFLEKGEKEIEIYFPWSMRGKIKNFEISNNASLFPLKRRKTMISYGDSITQGYDAIYPANSYVSKLAKALDCDVYNKAIGGDTFFPELLEAKEGFIPDIVTVAYGVNDSVKCSWGEFVFNCKTFFELLYENYKSSKIYVITPIWVLREDGRDPTKLSLSEVREFIKQTAHSYENVTIIDGFELVPCKEEFFTDGLHPNDEGFKFYIENLIKNLKF